MTSDDMTRQLIPDQRFDQPELGQTGLQFAIGGRCRRQDAARVVSAGTSDASGNRRISRGVMVRLR